MGRRRKKDQPEDREQPKKNKRLFDKALERARTHPKIKVEPRFG